MKAAQQSFIEAVQSELNGCRSLTGCSSEDELKTKVYQVATRLSAATGAHTIQKREAVRAAFAEACDELRSKYRLRLLGAFTRKVVESFLLAPVCGLFLTLGSLMFWPVWLIGAWVIWAQAGDWIRTYPGLAAAIFGLGVYAVGLVYALGRVIKHFAFSWSFSPTDFDSRAVGPTSLDKEFSKVVLSPITVASRPSRVTIRTDATGDFESPALSGLRGGLATHSLSGLIAGAVINIGVQVWEGMSAENRRCVAQEAADRKFESDMKAHEAEVSRIGALSIHAKSQLVKTQAESYLRRLDATIRAECAAPSGLGSFIENLRQKENAASRALELSILGQIKKALAEHPGDKSA